MNNWRTLCRMGRRGPSDTAIGSGFRRAGGGCSVYVAKDGFAYGINVDAPTEEVARATALSNCKGTNPSSQVQSQLSSPARDLCTVVTTFHHQCAAVAEDPAAGTPGIGWGIAPTLDAATRQALDNCVATAGETRSSSARGMRTTAIPNRRQSLLRRVLKTT